MSAIGISQQLTFSHSFRIADDRELTAHKRVCREKSADAAGGACDKNIALSANLDHNGAHACTAGVFPVRLLNFFKFEGCLYGHRDFSGSKPFKKQVQVRNEVLRCAPDAEESGSFARPEEQVLGQ